MNLPNVFMIGWEFPPHNSGGLGTACKGLTQALSRSRINQTFVLPKKLPITSPFLSIENHLNPFFLEVHVNMEVHPYGKFTDEYDWYLS
jgi:hypothetical protein